VAIGLVDEYVICGFVGFARAGSGLRRADPRRDLCVIHFGTYLPGSRIADPRNEVRAGARVRTVRRRAVSSGRHCLFVNTTRVRFARLCKAGVVPIDIRYHSNIIGLPHRRRTLVKLL
jgi:hypothetical protein